MGLADRLSAAQAEAKRERKRPPKGYEDGIRYEGGKPAEIGVTLAEIPEEEAEWRSEIERVTGLSVPEDREVKLAQVRMWGDPEEPKVYCRFLIEDRPLSSASIDIEDIVAATKKVKAKTPRKTVTDRSLIVSWADLQVGKVDSRGGTEELIERVLDKLADLERHAKELKCESAYLIDVGDCVESFENTSEQGFMNDLSFPEQLRVARRLYTEAVTRLARLHNRVVCTSVPSNHARWRRGKGNLGRPGDDFGIETLVAVSDALDLNPGAFDHVSFVVPEPWQEIVSLDVHGTILSVAHGHQVTNPNKVTDWWAKQVHGGQPGADADILLTGHFHHLRVEPSGWSAHTGKSKWWIQAPTLDNGSTWWRIKSGCDSEPGLATFTVDADGWDNLKIL